MPHSDIVQRAFEIVRREPALWVMGFILALFGGGSYRGDWNTQAGDLFGSGPNPDPTTPPETLPLPELPAWLTPETIVSLILALVALLFLWSLLSLIVQSIALTGLIHGTARAVQGIDVRWSDLLRAGWSAQGRRLFGMKLLLSLPALLLFLLLVGILFSLGLPLLPSLLAGDLSEPDMPALVGSILGMVVAILCLSLLLLLLNWVLSLIGNYAARSIVLENRPTADSLRHGWQLLRRHLADSIVLSLLLFVIHSVMGFLFSLLFLVFTFILGLPLFFLLSTLDFPHPLTIIVSFGAFLLAALLGGALAGPLLAYTETAWTLAWQHLNPTSELPVPLLPESTLL